MNEEIKANINQMFELLSAKADSKDVVDQATVNNLYTEIKSLQGKLEGIEAAQSEQADLLARKSSTKSVSADQEAADSRAEMFCFVKGQYAVTHGDVKADEFSRLVDIEGGHTIPVRFDSEITRGLGKTSVIRSLSRVLAVSGDLDRIIKFRTAGPAKTKSEKDAYTRNTVDTFAKLRWGQTQIFDQQRHTAWLSQHAESVLGLGQELQDSIVLNLAEKEGDLFLNGTVQNSVQDVTGVPATNMGLLNQTLSTTAPTKFTDNFGVLGAVEFSRTGNLSDAVLILKTTLHSNYLPNARLVFSSDVELKIMQEKDNNGRPVWKPADASIAGQFAGTIYGLPYVIDDMMPTVDEAVASGKPAMLLADFAQAYTIADFGRTNWQVDPLTEPQYVKYTAGRRLGAAIVDYKAIRALVLTA